jgi:hypothetical protein
MSDAFAMRLADRYHLRWTEPWLDWWRHSDRPMSTRGAFHQPMAVDELLQPTRWPLGMPADCLPWISNGYGDWLCVRIEAEGDLGEILYWNHGGGDQLPLGSRWSEALLYDHCRVAWCGQSWNAYGEPSRSQSLDRWVFQSVSSSAQQLHRVRLDHLEGPDGWRWFHDMGWTLDAIALDRVDAALQSEAQRLATPKHARWLQIDWDRELCWWLFDSMQFPSERLEQFQNLLLPQDPKRWLDQRWDEAIDEAQHLLARRSDQSWAWDIAGWGALRQERLQQAADCWVQALSTSVFTDQSVRLRKHGANLGGRKFAANRLLQIDSPPTSHQIPPAYWEALTDPKDTRGVRVVEYWMERARREEASPEERYAWWYRAGWDVGCHDLRRLEDILKGMEECAMAAGWVARATVAHAHRQSLEQRRRRFGVPPRS